MAKVTFKTNLQNQMSLFPYSFDNFVDASHPVRLVDRIIDRIDISDILSTYAGGGTSSFHPRMMLKVIIYGYLNNLYSSRKIAKALKENVHFIWLSGQQFPDHRTINYFRGKRLKNSIEAIFKQVVLLLQGEGIITLEEVFTDGTKIESAANRYTFVWKKSIEKYKAKLEEKIQAVLDEINQVFSQEGQTADKAGEDNAPINLTSDELNEKIEELNRNIKGQNVPKSLKKKINKLQSESVPKLQEYEIHLKILGERNSYSKTDKDATFMRMKEDHMKNGQLKPAYNLQLSTENNFITNYTLHQNPGDTTTYQYHLNSFYGKYGFYPQRSVADAGYGGLENYDFMEKHGIENYVKFNYFHKEQTKKFKTDISRPENLYYNEHEDCFICPMGQKMKPIGPGKRGTRTGYEYEVTIYQAKNCSCCPLRGACHKQKGDRKIEVNKKLVAHKQKARENLSSELGRELRGRRNSEVEQTFGQLKSNKGFKRFLLRGIPKISIELGLLALAHNFQKLSKYLINCELKGGSVGFYAYRQQILTIYYKLRRFIWMSWEKPENNPILLKMSPNTNYKLKKTA
jgi:transposase